MSICVVDIQPSYKSSFPFDLNDLIEFLNTTNEEILYLFNGVEVGGESEVGLKIWLCENGLDEDRLDEITFYEKNYGFFRSYMDMKGTTEGLRTLLQYMLDNKIYDSREVDPSNFENNEEIADFLNSDDCVFIPSGLMKILSRFANHYEVCGGDRSECLKEVTIALDLLKKSYTLLDEFIFPY